MLENGRRYVVRHEGTDTLQVIAAECDATIADGTRYKSRFVGISDGVPVYAVGECDSVQSGGRYFMKWAGVDATSGLGVYVVSCCAGGDGCCCDFASEPICISFGYSGDCCGLCRHVLTTSLSCVVNETNGCEDEDNCIPVRYLVHAEIMRGDAIDTTDWTCTIDPVKCYAVVTLTYGISRDGGGCRTDWQDRVITFARELGETDCTLCGLYDSRCLIEGDVPSDTCDITSLTFTCGTCPDCNCSDFFANATSIDVDCGTTCTIVPSFSVALSPPDTDCSVGGSDGSQVYVESNQIDSICSDATCLSTQYRLNIGGGVTVGITDYGICQLQVCATVTVTIEVQIRSALNSPGSGGICPALSGTWTTPPSGDTYTWEFDDGNVTARALQFIGHYCEVIACASSLSESITTVASGTPGWYLYPGGALVKTADKTLLRVTIPCTDTIGLDVTCVCSDTEFVMDIDCKPNAPTVIAG